MPKDRSTVAALPFHDSLVLVYCSIDTRE